MIPTLLAYYILDQKQPTKYLKNTSLTFLEMPALLRASLLVYTPLFPTLGGRDEQDAQKNKTSELPAKRRTDGGRPGEPCCDYLT